MTAREAVAETAESRATSLRDGNGRCTLFTLKSERPRRFQRPGGSDLGTWIRGPKAMIYDTRNSFARNSDAAISDRPFMGDGVKPFRTYDDEGVGDFRLYDDEVANDDGAEPIAGSLLGSLFRLGFDATHDPISERELGYALEFVAPDLRDQAKEAWAKGLTKCESPIEKVLLPWLICQQYAFFNMNPAVLFSGETGAYVPMTIAVIPQLKIGRYRADFALAGSRGGLVRFVVVECDGKAFHDGVENVKRDVDRDVAILANKRVLDVVRFDGKDILRTPQLCAQRAALAVREAWRKGNPETASKFEGA